MPKIKPIFRSIGLVLILTTVPLRAEPAAEPNRVTLNGHTFTLPEGFAIEQVAGPPLVDRPICADFDEQGVLYVAEAHGTNDKVQIQVETRPNRIVRLEDTDGDGRFDKRVVFADQMAFPEGTLWYEGSLYVAAPPQIWKLTDTDADHVADRREVWFDGKTLTHCGNDLHGPYLGPDGWFYWCKGGSAEQTYQRPDKPPLVTRAAHVFRRRPEGGWVEPVMAGGMDNPVEVAFSAGGERFFTTTFLQHPGGGLRDGLIHAVYGGVYGKVRAGLEGHARTGPIMPVLSHLGAAAPCGLARLETAQLGDAYRDNLLACLFNMHKITRHVLTPVGGAFESHHQDFLNSDNLDFHPTDVLEDADGSVLVVDTGGWYKLCCPTSQLHKPDVLGAIYRVRRKGSHRVADPRAQEVDWAALSVEQLAERLADPRIAVRRRAVQLLSRHGVEAVGALSRALVSSSMVQQRLHAVWCLTRIDHPQARAAVCQALDDEDETVRHAALHSISVHRDGNAEAGLLKMLENPSAQNRRAAAEALGRVGSSRAVGPLLAAVAQCSDRALEHSLIYAVVEIADGRQARLALSHEDARVRRAAMIALDQMPGGDLQVADVRQLLDAEDPLLHEAAWWIAEQHPDWADDLADYFQRAVSRDFTRQEEWDKLTARLATFALDPAIQQVMAQGLTDKAATRRQQVAILKAMISGQLKTMPPVWSEPLARLLTTTDPELLETAVGAVGAMAGSNLNPALVEKLQSIACRQQLPPQVRLQALVAQPAAARQIDEQSLGFLCDHLSVDKGVQLRSLAVDVLLGTRLNKQQLQQVADALCHTGPMALKRLLEMFGKLRDREVGLRLVAALEQCPSTASLSTDVLKQQLAGYGQEVAQKAQPLLARLEQENRDKVQKLESILALVEAGDVRRGQSVFQSTEAACVACHAMGYLGGRVGPDLTRIGTIRSHRDLLEAILFPSVSLVRSYEPTTIITVDGRAFNGVILEETGEEIRLQLDAQKEVRIAVADVDQRSPGTVSIMPSGLDKQFTPQQLADLVAFLKAAQ